jgi:predicted AAA+ superfamily ATPase
LGNFSPVAERSDKGPIFENFFVAERLKGATLEPYRVEVLFWRNRQAEEIDVIEVRGEAIQAFECKWKEGTQKAVPKSFIKKYPTATYVVVTPNTLVEKISDRVGSA